MKNIEIETKVKEVIKILSELNSTDAKTILREALGNIDRNSKIMSCDNIE